MLLGQRRMGKTEIFKRVVNRLFFEQDHQEPKAVVPVYYSFPEEKQVRWEFSSRYVENFVRWYAAFRLRDPSLISKSGIRRHELADYIKANMKVSKPFAGALNFIQWLEEKDVTIPEMMRCLFQGKFLIVRTALSQCFWTNFRIPTYHSMTSESWALCRKPLNPTPVHIL
ncbi:MAG: hypothetical protein DRR08_20875 [Candidatus Parabeggiatoa sp. nov. 2]|nr:MAG: hypothetical protein B6247_21840 [Beggiatoa sp. 4572_84]RKZ56749.1 MAG: hypothetical protein DRR08_20875 [Gammaproteobacteria bacterium]